MLQDICSQYSIRKSRKLNYSIMLVSLSFPGKGTLVSNQPGSEWLIQIISENLFTIQFLFKKTSK